MRSVLADFVLNTEKWFWYCVWRYCQFWGISLGRLTPFVILLASGHKTKGI